MKTPQPFIAACLQMRSTRDAAQNCHSALQFIEQAAQQGAAYIQTPEMTNLVERNAHALWDKTFLEQDDPTLKALREAARRHQITLHIGSLALRAGSKPSDKMLNRGFVIDPHGAIIARYDKIHLFDVDLAGGESWRESNTYQGGDKAVLADTPCGKIGLSICYDVRFPQLYQALAQGGAAILSAPACFTKTTGEAHWHVLQRARAIETGSFMIAAAQGSLHEDGRETFGHSLIIDPWGRILAEAGLEPCVIMAEIDLAHVTETRARIPALKNAREFKPPIA
jgi:deaminated glutathione amidase